jgi:hypothetical protein
MWQQQKAWAGEDCLCRLTILNFLTYVAEFSFIIESHQPAKNLDIQVPDTRSTQQRTNALAFRYMQAIVYNIQWKRKHRWVVNLIIEADSQTEGTEWKQKREQRGSNELHRVRQTRKRSY